jgi:type I restriction enzyme S subunit
MASEWRECALGDVIELKRGYDLPQQGRHAGDVAIISSSGPSGFHNEAKVKGPGVVTGRYGTLGEVFYVRDDFWPLNTTLYVRDFKGNEPRFISYFLRGLDFLAYSDKAAVPGLNRNHLHQAQVSVPSDPFEQRAIAHILGTLDDKIELNRRMSETLEAMARALFTSWFVDFDPVRAKAEGRDPSLPQPLADLFPARLVDSELGEIPDGWGVGTLADYYDAVKGVSYKGSGLGERGTPLHNLNSVYEGGGYKYEGIKYYTGEYAERHIVLPGDVIVANTEQGHDRLLIGYAATVPTRFGERGIASHHMYRMRPRPRSPLTSAYLCRLLNSPQMHDVVSGYANGTTVNMLPLDGVQKPAIIVPPTDLVLAFDSIAVLATRRGEELVSESHTLVMLRDALLPKLISGELRVRDAGNLVADFP